MKTPDLTNLWASLRTSAPAETAGDFRMRLCHETHELRVFAAVADVSRDASIVVEIPEALKPKHLNAISGRRLTVYAGGVSGLSAGRTALVVRLRDAAFEDLFCQLGTDLVSQIQSAPTAAAAIQGISRLIERWRRFLDQRRSVLSSEEVRGLIGELAVLERSIGRMGAQAALTTWKAPGGSIRDFECPDRTVEVKSTLTSLGGSVRINDPMQLEPEPGVSLYLVCQELGRSTAPECTLSGHAARLAKSFSGDVQLTEDFENALAGYGYLPSHAESYTEGYILGPLHAFLVRPDFPRIRPNAIPPGVSRVEFSLEIVQLTQFRVNENQVVGPLPQLPASSP